MKRKPGPGIEARRAPGQNVPPVVPRSGVTSASADRDYPLRRPRLTEIHDGVFELDFPLVRPETVKP